MQRIILDIILLMICLVVIAAIIGLQGSGKNRMHRMYIYPIKDGRLLTTSNEKYSSDKENIDYGNRTYKILSQDDDLRIRLRVLIYSCGREEEVFSTVPISISENKNLFFIEVDENEVHISQIDGERGTFERTWDVGIDELLLKNSFTSSAYNWLDEEMLINKRVHLFQFFGTMHELLYTVDANVLVEEEKRVFTDHNDQSSMLIILEECE